MVFVSAFLPRVLKSFSVIVEFGMLWLELSSNFTYSLFLLFALDFSLMQPRCWQRRAKVKSPSVVVYVLSHCVMLCHGVVVAFPCGVCV